MLWAARRVGRPVKWTQTRSEAHISDDDARDNIVDAALALDRDGKFLAVKIRSFGNLGAFVSFRGAMPPVINIGTVVGTYNRSELMDERKEALERWATHVAGIVALLPENVVSLPRKRRRK